jgi:glycosyltransferase involved in cell wall biosynthesis
MKVAIVTETSVWGGLEAHTVGLARILIEDDNDVCVVCLGAKTAAVYQRVIGDSLPIVVVDAPSGPARANPFRWHAVLREVRAEKVLFQKGTLHTGGVALDVALRWRFGRYLAVEHLEPPVLPPRTTGRYAWGTIPGVGLWWYRQRLRGYLRSLGPHVTVCVSDSVAHALVTQYGFQPTRLITIRNGIDTRQFRPDVARRARVRATWSVPPDGVVIGTMRRLVAEKGIDVAIEAFGQLVTTVPNRKLIFVIAGEGPERERLFEQACRLGLRDEVRFLGFSREPWLLYPGFDVFLLPSRIEALGAVAAEALSSGCEVIASRVGGIPEIVSDPELGTLVPAGDSSALAQAVKDAVVRSDDDRARRAIRARDHVMQHFDARTQFRRFADLLRDL